MVFHFSYFFDFIDHILIVNVLIQILFQINVHLFMSTGKIPLLERIVVDFEDMCAGK